jgi:hypothetical protein
MDRLERFFYPMDIEIIRNIPLCTGIQEDFWAWHFEKFGVFSIRSVYQTLTTVKKAKEDYFDGNSGSSNLSREGKLWEKLWKCKVPPKFQIFLWRLAHCSLPTGDVRHHRGMALTPACLLCGQNDEWRHSLFECTPSRLLTVMWMCSR